MNISTIDVFVDIIVLFYIIMSLCGVLSFVFDVITRKRAVQKSPPYKVFADRVFNLLNIPLSIISVLAVIIRTWVNIGHDNTQLIVLSSFILLSLLIEVIRNWQGKDGRHTWVVAANHECAYQTTFNVANDYFAAKVAREKIFSLAGEKISLLLNNINNHHVTLDSVYSGINDYIQSQKDDCISLLNNRDVNLSLLATLENNVKKCNEYFTSFIEKINASAASIQYCTKSQDLLNDIGKSFQVEYKYQSAHVNTEIEGIVSKINNVSHKCSQFTKLFNLFDETVQLYSSRLESSLVYKPSVYVSEKGESLTLNDVIGSVFARKSKWPENAAETVDELYDVSYQSRNENLEDILKNVLPYVDQFLRYLPENKTEEFEKSEHFDTYKKIIKELTVAK